MEPPISPGTEIDLSNKDAWDDTELLGMYDRAISAYENAHGATPELLSVLRTKHCSRATTSSTPGSGKHGALLSGEAEDDEEEVVDEEEGEEEDADEAGNFSRNLRRFSTARDISVAEAKAAAEAEAEATAAAEAEAAEEARQLEWARYYAWQQQQQQQPPPPPPPPTQPPAAVAASSHAPPPMLPMGMGAPPAFHAAAASAATATPATPADYDTDMSNLVMAWYHAGFFTAQFQERHRR